MSKTNINYIVYYKQNATVIDMNISLIDILGI